MERYTWITHREKIILRKFFGQDLDNLVAFCTELKILGPKCPKCGSIYDSKGQFQPIVYSGKHDSKYCQECNIWLEEKCEDISCTFCRSRPQKPLKTMPLKGGTNEKTGTSSG